MGLNLPMLLANSQPLETWNPVGQFSPPPISDRNHQLRVPLPMPFSATPQSDLNASGTSAVGGGPRSLFGGSSNSDFTGSPQKPMDTTDIENDEGTKEHDTKCERTTPSNIHDTSVQSNEGRLSTGPNGTPGAPGSENGTCHGDVGSAGGMSSGGGGGSVGGGVGAGRRSDGTSGTEAGSSPIPNTNTFEAHKQRHLIAGGAVPSGSRGGHDDLDIKQELLENYFHAPHPPAPPDSHRSYSSTDENRHGGADSADDFAQDLRVSAAAAAAAKGLDFSRFVLPPSLRRSTESIDEKFTPLNMRKLNPASASSSQAGQMLMNSLLSNESMSEDNTSISGRIKSGSLSGNPNGLSGSQDASSSAAAAAAAAAIYAESLNKDDCDFIGSNVSVKLRTMDRTQRIIAEKLISEVLYYGQFNELERSARIQPK